MVIITKNENLCNIPQIRLRPKSKQERWYIQCSLKNAGYSFIDVEKNIGVKSETVLNVVAGRRRSRKVEAEIARLLGRSDWNEVVIEARLAVSNPAYRPTQKDIDEYKAEVAARFCERAEQKQRIIESLAPMREAVGAIKNQRR